MGLLLPTRKACRTLKGIGIVSGAETCIETRLLVSCELEKIITDVPLELTARYSSVQ